MGRGGYCGLLKKGGGRGEGQHSNGWLMKLANDKKFKPNQRQHRGQQTIVKATASETAVRNYGNHDCVFFAWETHFTLPNANFRSIWAFLYLICMTPRASRASVRVQPIKRSGAAAPDLHWIREGLNQTPRKWPAGAALRNLRHFECASRDFTRRSRRTSR